MADRQSRTPALRWAALILSGAALLWIFVVDLTDKQWFSAPNGHIYKADWDELGLSIFFNTVPPFAEAYLGDWRLGAFYIGLTLLVIGWWPRRMWARIVTAAVLAAVAVLVLLGAFNEYPASIGLIDYYRALAWLGGTVGLLLLLGAGLIASPYRRFRAALTAAVSLGLVVVHVVAISDALAAAEGAGYPFTQQFASWMPAVGFATIAVAGALFAVAPDDAR